jgi:EAL domain-containing protein (putative c-di-GMP-specific phosphodiesterase class I)
MECQKCQEVLALHSHKGTLHFLSEYAELISKVSSFLDQLSISFKNENAVCSVEVDDQRAFFEFNLESIKRSFSDEERQAIKLFIEDENRTFSLQAVLAAKPFQRYINLLEDKEFFDIVDNESLTSYFQPIVDAQSHDIYGYEALIRGVKDDGSLLYPDELFEKSKRNDLNFRLDRLCRETALKTAATKRINQKVFINFIPTTIYDPEFCLASTQKWAKQLEFNPSQIVFEVVETELVRDQKHLKKILEFYRSKGYKIALDDVGEGYSSLNMLIELRPDIIKIDRNIIDHIHENSLKQSVYKALSTLAKEHGIEVLAEGVETIEELNMVKSLGVDYIQGYYFSKPTAEPIRKIIRK